MRHVVLLAPSYPCNTQPLYVAGGPAAAPGCGSDVPRSARAAGCSHCGGGIKAVRGEGEKQLKRAVAPLSWALHRLKGAGVPSATGSVDCTHHGQHQSCER